MSTNVLPFRNGSGPDGPRSRASGRVEARTLLPAADQSETLRQTRCIIRECWELRAESAAIKRRYEERRARIAVLMARYPDVERA